MGAVLLLCGLGGCGGDASDGAGEPDGDVQEGQSDAGDTAVDGGPDAPDAAEDALDDAAVEDLTPDAELDPPIEDQRADGAVDPPFEDGAADLAFEDSAEVDEGLDTAADAPGDASDDGAADVADEGADTGDDTASDMADLADVPADTEADPADVVPDAEPDVVSDCGNGVIDEGEDCDPVLDVRCPDTCSFTRDVSAFYVVGGPTSESYIALDSGTALDVMGMLDDGTASLTLPFEFELFGEPHTAVNVSVNGLAWFGEPAGEYFENVGFPTLAPPDGLVAAWWDDLYLDTAVAGGAALHYAVTGAAPFRIVTIEWLGVRKSGQSTSNHRRFTFQLALFETSNRIELRYGETATSGNPPTATSASVGIENASGVVGQDLLGCSPTCAGPPRPATANGFPRQTRIVLEPL